MRLATLVVALGLLLPAGASALGPGDLDTSFGSDGVVFTPFGGLVDEGSSLAAARDVAVLPDGRLLVAGSAADEDGRRAFALARYRPDGRLDRSFAADGKLVLQLGSTDDATSAAGSVAAVPGGGAVAAGHATDGNGDQAVAVTRIDRRGNVLWQRTHQLGTGAEPGSSARDVVLTDDSVIVVGRASTEEPSLDDPFVARMDLAKGQLDPVFAGTGYLLDPPDRSDPGEDCSFGGAEAGAVTVREDGTIVAGGTVALTCSGGESGFSGFLHAYTTSGGRAGDFGTGDPQLSSFSTVLVGADDMLLGAGTRAGGPAIARYDATGLLDVGFSEPDGYTLTPGDTQGAVTGLAMQDDERLVAAVDGPEDADRVTRLLADGDADSSFAGRGLGAAGLRSPRGLVLVESGGIVVAGDRPAIRGKEEQGFVLVRVHGGSSAGAVRVGGKARRRGGAVVVHLACRNAPGCAGTLGGPGVGRVAYHLAAGARRRIAVPVRAAKGSVTLRATNPPQPPVRKTVSVKR